MCIRDSHEAAFGSDLVIRQRSYRVGAGDDDLSDGAQGFAFAAIKLSLQRLVQAGFQRQRMMDQSHQPQPLSLGDDSRWHRAQRQAVHDRQRSRWQRGQYGDRCL